MIRRLFLFQFRGDATIWVVFLTMVILAGAGFLVGDIYPDLNQAVDNGEYFDVSDVNKNKNKNSNATAQLLQLDSKRQVRTPQGGGDPSSPSAPQCENNGAIAFLVDVSESMADVHQESTAQVDKMTQVKNVLKSFVSRLPASTLVGLYTFSSPNFGEPKERVGFAEFGQVRGQLTGAIDGLQPQGATYMRDGLSFVQQKISIARDQYPGKQFSLIFISDGVPELIECKPENMPNNECAQGDGARNYDFTQDPTVDGDISQQIRQSGTHIYSIAMYNNDDLEITGRIQQILRTVATPGSYKPSIEGNQLQSIFDEINTSVCK